MLRIAAAFASMSSAIFCMLCCLGSAYASERVEELLSTLSLHEKAAQMTQIDINALTNGGSTLNDDLVKFWIKEIGVGSVLNSPFSGGKLDGKSGFTASEWRQLVIDLQKKSKVPILYGIDSIHGATYVKNAALFPQQIATAATFNAYHALTAGRITAKDSRAAALPWLFSPVLGIAVQPLWARVPETWGEDPFLSAEMASAIVTGIQYVENDGGIPWRAAACMKHFIAYSNPESGHDRQTSSIPDRIVKQLYRPPFEAAVKAGVMTTMENYVDVGGVPMVSSKEYLVDMLRYDLNFTGLLVTDWQEIENLAIFHMVTETYKDAVRIAMQDTSIDMSMVPYDISFTEDLVALVKEGVIPESRVDESVRRILTLKEALGLFDTPVPALEDPLVQTVGQDTDWKASLDAARESIVLLKNEGGLLPLDAQDSSQKILLTGPTCNSVVRQTGGWAVHWQGGLADDEYGRGYTLKQGLDSIFKGIITYHPGVDVTAEDISGINQTELAEAARTADVIIACMGEGTYAEKPGDIDKLDIASGQTEYMQLLATYGKPIVLVLFEGRPRLLNGMKEISTCVVHGLLSGPMGGKAVAEVLAGQINPSGKLPITYPKNSGVIRPYHRKPSLLCRNPSAPYTDVQCEVEWEFGEGLSYTTFEYANLRLSATSVTENDIVQVTVTVTNTGSLAGMHPVLMFLTDVTRRVTPEYKLLKGFTKVSLQPGQSTDVGFVIDASAMSYYGIESRAVLESGEFRVGIGYDADCRANNWEEQMCASYELQLTEDYDALCQYSCVYWTSSAYCGTSGISWDACLPTCKKEQWSWNYLSCIEETFRSGSCEFNTYCRDTSLTLETALGSSSNPDSSSRGPFQSILVAGLLGAVVGGVIVAIGVQFVLYSFSSNTRFSRVPLAEQDSTAELVHLDMQGATKSTTLV